MTVKRKPKQKEPETMTDTQQPIQPEGSETTDSQLEECQRQLIRLQADFDNFRKRAQKDKEDMAAFVMEGFLSSLLPVVDNLERALSSAQTAKDVESMRGGIQLVYRQFLSILEREGIQCIHCMGQPFDPGQHQAIMTVPDPEKSDNTVVEENQKGYTYRGKVIRPAMVTVSRQE
jgi:molecular chaperone GrpE